MSEQIQEIRERHERMWGRWQGSVDALPRLHRDRALLLAEIDRLTDLLNVKDDLLLDAEAREQGLIP